MGTVVYTAEVENITRGWSYSYTQGDVPDRADPVQVADGATYSWGFADELVPHAMHQLAAGFGLWCHSLADVPTVDTGDEIRLRVTVAGTTLVDSPPLYVSSVETDTDLPPGAPPDGYHALVTIRCVDDTAQLPGYKPQPRTLVAAWGTTPAGTPFGQQRWMQRIGEIGQQIGRSVGRPSWWPSPNPLTGTAGGGGGDQPIIVAVPGGTDAGVSGILWSDDAAAMLEGTVNTGQPGRQHHTLVPSWEGAYPAGYSTVIYPFDGAVDPNTGLADPASSRRLLMVPASRRTPNQSWPLELVVTGGVLTLQPAAASAAQVAHDRIGLDAAWCDLPVRARRAREHVFNTITLKSLLWRTRYEAGDPASVSSTVPGSVTVSDPATPLGEPQNRREVPTYIWVLGQEPGSTFFPGESAIPYQGKPYDHLWWSDASQRAAWVYDSFTVRASRVPVGLRDRVLPRLAPRIPGEPDGNGQILKHLTIYRPADSMRFADAPGLVTGFVTQGQLRIIGGDLVYGFTLTPGLPIALDGGNDDTTTATPVTVAQVDAATYQGQPVADIDPLIRVSDLAYVAA